MSISGRQVTDQLVCLLSLSSLKVSSVRGIAGGVIFQTSLPSRPLASEVRDKP